MTMRKVLVLSSEKVATTCDNAKSIGSIGFIERKGGDTCDNAKSIGFIEREIKVIKKKKCGPSRLEFKADS